MPANHHTALGKLPALTLIFWVTKLAATTLGETAGDLLSQTLHAGYLASTIILMSGFLAVLTGQLAARRYNPWLYWSAVLATSMAGTTMSDLMSLALGLGFAGSSAILIGLFTVVLIAWRRTAKSLSPGDVRSPRAEVFYWSAILVYNTLGTSLGDYLAETAGLGFAGGAAVTGGALAVIGGAYLLARRLQFPVPSLNVVCFCAACLLTRPLGVILGDLLTKDHEQGGLGFGTVGSSIALAGVLVAAIYSSMPGSAKRPDACLRCLVRFGPIRLPVLPCVGLLAAGMAVIPWDGVISSWAGSVRLSGDVKRELETAQQFGDLLSIGLVATLIWLLDADRRRLLRLGTGALLGAGLVGFTAKILIGRPRPRFDDPSFLGPWATFDVGGKAGVRHAWEFWSPAWSDLSSMPSSHTLFAAALAAFLALAYPRLRGLVLALTVLVGIARVVLRAHYPSDVLVGAALGWFAGTLGMMIVQRLRPAAPPDAA